MSDSVGPHRQQPTRFCLPWDSPGKNTGVGCHFLLQRMKVKSQREVAQSCPTLSDPMDCSPPGTSTHGIFQARVLEWVATAFSTLRHYRPSIDWLLNRFSPLSHHFYEQNIWLAHLELQMYIICWGIVHKIHLMEIISGKIWKEGRP